jgi:DNA-binding NtrC family response regulator
VKLLRVLQEGQITRVGATRARRIDVRVIAATNRDLLREVAEARFREDLFFRLAVLVLKLPPLRQRTGDLVPLIDGLLGRINAESASEPDYVEKKLAVGARNVLLQHAWPGNVRELQNTLRRAAVWSDGATIQKADIEEALLTFPPAGRNLDAILAQPIDQGVDLKALMHKVASHYLEQAMKASGGNKTRAAELVGLPNYQTFSNWLSKYGRA